MFFLNLKNPLKISHIFLINKSNNHIMKLLHTSTTLKTNKKNIFRHAPFHLQLQASVTLETSLVLPIFLFFIVNLLSFMDILRIQIDMDAALSQTARELAVYGHAFDEVLNIEDNVQKVTSVIFSESYVRKEVRDYLGKEYLEQSNIYKGSGGIVYSFSNIMTEDKIDLVALYQVEPVVPYIGFRRFFLTNRCMIRAFTGYDNAGEGSDGEDEEMVYITSTGTVYHKNRNCTHLRLSISLAELSNINNLRNDHGHKYLPCALCGEKAKGKVYITNDGTSYHGSIECSGLKRTVSAVLISQVGDKGPCSRCSGTLEQ